jgi:ribosome-binding ATPase YchF (GTP1/OBG family)
MSLQNEAQRGELAKQVIENEVYAEAYTLLEQEITRAWRDSRDAAEREELHRALRSLVKVQKVLESTMNSGKVAAATLQAEKTRAQRIMDTFRAN